MPLEMNVRASAVNAAAAMTGTDAFHRDLDGDPDLNQITPDFMRLVSRLERYISTGEWVQS